MAHEAKKYCRVVKNILENMEKYSILKEKGAATGRESIGGRAGKRHKGDEA